MGPPAQDGGASAEHNAEVAARLETLQDKLREMQQEGQPAAEAQPSGGAAAAEESDGDDSDAPSIDSGAEESDSDAVRA